MTDYVILGTNVEAHNCPMCGVLYTCPKTMIEAQRKTGLGRHFCPNGHGLGWENGGSENERLRRERDRLKQDQARLEQEKADLEAARRKALDDLARHKKRAANGTCPCCRRTFANMARHMKTKHPNYNVVPLTAVEA